MTPTASSSVRLFVSSTFRDMQAERDHLVKVVFPALRERLEPYRVDVVDVDLRWGITAQQAENGQVLALCLDEIEASRPFFVGLLGQRYGWVPPSLPREATRRFGWIQHETGKSITELEILHGVLRNPEMAGRAFFYFRAPDALETIPPAHRRRYEAADPAQRQHLRTLKERIRASGLPVMDGYPATWNPDAAAGASGTSGRLDGLGTFGRRVLEDLWTAIREELGLPDTPPRDATTSPLARAQSDHARFMDQRLVGVSPAVHKAIHATLEAYAFDASSAASTPLLLAGTPGAGKSTALARLVRALQRNVDEGERDDLLVIPHFTGAGPRSTSLRALLVRVLQVLDAAYGIDADPSAQTPALVRSFHDALQRVPREERLVLVVDAVNQFDARDRAELLSWLPRTLPPNVRVVLSATRSAAAPSTITTVAERRGFRVVEVPALNDAERLTIAREVPAIAAKTLSAEQLDLLLNNPATRNPLFLRVALEELRGFGSFETLADRIRSFPRPSAERAPTTAIFAQVVERLEQDFDAELVRELLRLLGSARRGLTEAEMRVLVAPLPGAEDLFPVLRQLRPYLMRRGPVTAVFHHALSDAIRETYLADASDRVAAHRRLADYFDGTPDFLSDADDDRLPNGRKADELPWHLLRSNEIERLADRLQTLSFAEAKAEAGLVDDLATDYTTAADHLAADHPARHIITVLGRAIAHEMSFLVRHPDCLFQVCSNRSWWTDAPKAEIFFEVTESAEADYQPPWKRIGPKACELLDDWRRERDRRTETPWVRRLLPPTDLFVSDSRIFRGHEKLVPHVAWSPDGARLASASWDGTVRVWQVAGPGDELVLEGHDSFVQHVSWSSDGTRLASASDDGTVCLWDASDLGLIRTMKGHRGMVQHVAWSPDGAQLASAAHDGTVLVWHAHTNSAHGDPIVLEAGGSDVRHVAWSPSGHRLAGALADATVCVWRAETWTEPLVLHGPAMGFRYTRGIPHVAWSPDGKRIAAASWDGTVWIWDADGVDPPITLRGHHADVLCVAWSPGGNRLASASVDETVRVWCISSEEPIATYHGHSEAVKHLAWSPSGRHLASASDDSTVRIWPVGGSDHEFVLRGHGLAVWHVAWSPDGHHIASSSADRTVRVWAKPEHTQPLRARGHRQAVRKIAWAPAGSQLASASFDTTVRVWSWDGHAPVVLKGHTKSVEHVAWSPDGIRLASCSWDGTVRIWQAGIWDTPTVLRGHTGAVQHVAWSPTGDHIASASGGGLLAKRPENRSTLPDHTVRIWPVDGKNDPVVLHGHEDSVHRVAWAPDGKHLASTSHDHTVRIWLTDGQHPPVVLRGHGDLPRHLAWSPSSARIATASADHTVRIWPSDGQSEPLVLRGHDRAVDFVTWSPDGSYLASKDHNRRVILWNAVTGRKLHQFKAPSAVAMGSLFAPHALLCVDLASETQIRIGTRDQALAWFEDGRFDRILCSPQDPRIWAARSGPDVLILTLEGAS